MFSTPDVDEAIYGPKDEPFEGVFLGAVIVAGA